MCGQACRIDCGRHSALMAANDESVARRNRAQPRPDPLVAHQGDAGRRDGHELDLSASSRTGATSLPFLRFSSPLEVADGERRGGALMSWYGGEGAATVFDSHGDTMFMEWLDGIPLGDAVASAAATTRPPSRIVFSVVAGLHRPRAEAQPMSCMPLRERFQALFDTDVRALAATRRAISMPASNGLALTKLFDRPSAHHPAAWRPAPRQHPVVGPRLAGHRPQGRWWVTRLMRWPMPSSIPMGGDKPSPSDPKPHRGHAPISCQPAPRLQPQAHARLGRGPRRPVGLLGPCRTAIPISGQLACLPHLLSAYDQA
jgi:streptomycin 6-kinase